MQENMRDYMIEKEKREKRLFIYEEKVQERMLRNFSDML